MRFAIAMALAAAACSPSSDTGVTASGTVTGAVDGLGVNALGFYAIDTVGTCTNDNGTQASTNELDIVISNFPGFCANSLADKAQSNSVSVLVSVSYAIGAAFTTGTFDVGATSGPVANIELIGLNASCQRSGGGLATAGSVTISSIDTGSVTGSFTGTAFNTSGTLSGSFTAVSCGLPPLVGSCNATAICK